jgi:hypothetical protein
VGGTLLRGVGGLGFKFACVEEDGREGANGSGV